MNRSYYNAPNQAGIRQPARRPAYPQQSIRQPERRSAPRRVQSSRRRTPASVYVARYILLLTIYLVLLGVSALGMSMMLKVNLGSGTFELTQAARTAAPASPASIMEVVDDEEYVLAAINNVSFKLDLSEFEQYMNPADRDAYIKLINQTHPLEKDYKPEDLVSVPYVRSGVETPYMRLYAAKALEAMLKEAYANGCSTSLTITSLYRSYDYQKFLLDYRISVYAYLGEEEAYKKATTIVAVPGQSEHQSGLAADIHTLASADETFEKSYEFKWLLDNCWKFGFIMRYPNGKTDITGIIYEPWHYRYVGRYHAFKIHESGLTLEEYCELTGLGLE